MPDTNNNTAGVTLQMSSFVANTSTSNPPAGPFCAASISIDPGSSRLSLDGSDLRVTRGGPLTITFTILPPQGSSAVSPQAVVLSQTNADRVPDSDGSQHFNVGSANGNQITVTDQFGAGDPSGTRPRWEYYIKVSRPTANGGTETGWIDPGIVNED